MARDINIQQITNHVIYLYNQLTRTSVGSIFKQNYVCATWQTYLTHRLPLKNCDLILRRLLFKEINYACKLYIAEMKLLSVVNCTMNGNSDKNLQHTTHVDWSAVIRAVFNGYEKFPIAIKFGNPHNSQHAVYQNYVVVTWCMKHRHTHGMELVLMIKLLVLWSTLYVPVTRGIIDLMPIW